MNRTPVSFVISDLTLIIFLTVCIILAQNGHLIIAAAVGAYED